MRLELLDPIASAIAVAIRLLAERNEYDCIVAVYGKSD